MRLECRIPHSKQNIVVIYMSNTIRVQDGIAEFYPQF